jgi:hypothetical protein
VAPGRRPAAVYGRLFAGALVAAAVTGLYAWAMSRVWGRWERKFSELPDDHALRDAAAEMAFALGVGVFLLSWAIADVRLRVRPARSS